VKLPPPRICRLIRKLHALTRSSDENEANNAKTKLDRLLFEWSLKESDIEAIIKVTDDAGQPSAATITADDIAGINLVDLIHTLLAEHVVVTIHEIMAATLWILHTYVYSPLERDIPDDCYQKGPRAFNHIQVKALPPHPEGKRRIRYYDSENLYVAVEALPSGNVSRSWRYDYYRPAGGRAELSLGTIPDVGLAEARRLRDRYNVRAHHRAAGEAVAAKEATSLAAASAGFLADMKRLGKVRESSLRRYTNNHLAIERGPLGKLPIGPLSTAPAQ
jgi:hypothetical protein